MTDDIRQSLARLEQIRLADLAAADSELTVLLTTLHKEVETRTNVLNTTDSTEPAYNTASSDLVDLLQLTKAVVDTKTELGKLALAAGKALQRVFKKATK
jgi:hypothetical protein